MIEFTKRSAWLALVSAAGVLGSVSAYAGTVTLQNASGNSCTFTSFTGGANGDFTFTCGSTTPPPSSTASCNGATFNATVSSPVSMPLACNSATSGASWQLASGPSGAPTPTGTSPSATFGTAGTYVYSVTPSPGGSPVTVTVVVSSGTTGPVGGSIDTSLCSAHPAGFKSQFAFSFGGSQLATIRDYYTLGADANGYTPIITVKLGWPSPILSASNGKFQVAESPSFAEQGIYKWLSISEKPCDFGQGGTAKFVTRGASPTMSYTVEAQEGYIYGFLASFKAGIRLQAGKTYYLNIVNGSSSGYSTPSCPAGKNCGVVIDLWQPQ